MATTIKCNKCANEIEITEAIKGELEEKILKETQAKHQSELAHLQKQNNELKIEQEQAIQAVRLEITAKARQDAIVKVHKDFEAKINATKEEAEERQKQNVQLQAEMSQLMIQLRESKNAQQNLEIEYQKKLFEEEDKIKEIAKKEAQDEMTLRIAEKDKKLSDAEKQINELQRKIQQGSQQLQGEVQELQLESILKLKFPYDEIKEVPKGINGADIIQIVHTQNGISCGTIVWESKNTKAWAPLWIGKLKEDQRALRAELAVIISNVLPQDIDKFGLVDGIWVTDLLHALGIAEILREQLIRIREVQLLNEGKSTKAEIVYDYLTSNEFKQRIEVLVEHFQERREEIDKERRYFMKKWEKDEKSLMKLIQNTSNLYGSLQGLVGSALPQVSYFELPIIEDELIEINEEIGFTNLLET